MALNKKFSAVDGLNFSIAPKEAPEPQNKETESTQKTITKKSTPKKQNKPKNNTGRFEKSIIKKSETKSIRKQFLIRESDNKRIEEECKRLDISQNEFINLLIKRYFE